MRYPLRPVGMDYVRFNALHLGEAARRRRGALAPDGLHRTRKEYQEWCAANAAAMVPWIRKRLRRELAALKRSLPPTAKVWQLCDRPGSRSR